LNGYLVLQNGEVFGGAYVGDDAWSAVGEVVFNTSMAGYQEILTDPSYYQQIIVMTAPMEGNYGVALAEREASKIWAQGFVCLELSTKYTEGRSTLLTELAEFKRPALTGVDTRRLTLELRRHGTPWGAIVQALSQDEAIKKATALIKERQQLVSKDWVYEVSVGARQVHKGEGKKGRIAVLDYGAKENILRELKARFSEVAIFNSRATAKEILDWAPNGIMLTNGPGDPSAVETAPTELKKILAQARSNLSLTISSASTILRSSNIWTPLSKPSSRKPTASSSTRTTSSSWLTT
jgi:carbamoyl-phosphate synthase small subunit